MLATPIATSMDIDEAAAFLGLHPLTLGERARAGIIPGAKIGKEWRFFDVDLLEYARRQYNKGEPCHSTNAPTAQNGGPVYNTAGDELDALLATPTSQRRDDGTTSLKLVSGKKSRQAARLPTRLSSGSKNANERGTT